MNKHFIWPIHSIRSSIFSLKNIVSESKLEEDLINLYPTGYPVLTSSGRSAIGLILSFFNLNRKNSIGLFPYASHCVIDSVSRICNPILGNVALNEEYRIVYHQWGFVQEFNLNEFCIEDCVDTLCEPGTDLFPGGSSFEIWSLSKIFGISGGGIIWCKNFESSKEIKKIRDNSNYNSEIQSLLKIFSVFSPPLLTYWEGPEASHGKLSFFNLGEINSSIQNIDFYLDDKKRKLGILKKYSYNLSGLIDGRYPSIFPSDIIPSERKFLKWNLSARLRNFSYRVGEEFISKIIFPVPLHFQISNILLERILMELNHSL